MRTTIKIDDLYLRSSDTFNNCIFINVPGPRFLRFGNEGLEIITTYSSDDYDQIRVMGVDEL